MSKDVTMAGRAPGRGAAGARRRVSARRLATAAATFMAGTGLAALATAQAAAFKQAPTVEQAEDTGPNTILGLIHVNTAFFIAVGVIAFLWFVFGGGRKAKVGRKGL